MGRDAAHHALPAAPGPAARRDAADRDVQGPRRTAREGRQFEGQQWSVIVDEIISHLPQKVYISFDIDGLDPKLCPNTGTPVQGGFETEQMFYMLRKIVQSGRQLIGFDLSEVGISNNEFDENVGARVLFKLCNLMMAPVVN